MVGAVGIEKSITFNKPVNSGVATAPAKTIAVQRTLRHIDIKTTLRFYVHADADVQRAALSQLQSLQM